MTPDCSALRGWTASSLYGGIGHFPRVSTARRGPLPPSGAKNYGALVRLIRGREMWTQLVLAGGNTLGFMMPVKLRFAAVDRRQGARLERCRFAGRNLQRATFEVHH